VTSAGRIRSLAALALLAALGLRPDLAHAQLSARIGAEFGFASGYLDRGVIRTNEPVIQPGLTIGLPAGSGGITLGLWATVQPVGYSSSEYFSMAPGEKSPNVTEIRPSLELSQPIGQASFAFKATFQMFPNTIGLTKDANTLDLASTLALGRLPFEPALTVAYDLGAISGPYLEGRLRQTVKLTKGAAMSVTGRAGWAIEQQVDSAPAAFSPYHRNGFTHLDLTVGANLGVAGASITPYLTYTYVPSPAAGSTYQRRDMLIFGTSVAVSGVFPKVSSKK
jgi:hypothetical protein